jgi:hypothetical protein
MFQNHPAVAADMLKSIPRLEKVSGIIRYQEKNFDGSGLPSDDIKGEAIPLGSRMLKLVIDYDQFVCGDHTQSISMYELFDDKDKYDPALVPIAIDVFRKIGVNTKPTVAKEIGADMLKEGMFLAADIITASGSILANKGQRITAPLIVTIQNYKNNHQVKDIIKVLTREE